MRVLSLRSAFYTPVILTASRFLPEAGVDVDLIFRTDENPSAMLRADELDFAQLAPSAAMSDQANGITDTPIHIASVNERDGFLLIGRNPEPDFSWSDVEGRSIVPASFAVQPEACLRYALHLQGVDATKVNLVGGLKGMAAAAEAFTQGTGDYVQLQDPMARNIVAAGKGHLVAAFGPAIGPIAFSSVVTSQRMLKQEPEKVQTFMSAYSKARHWIDQNDADAITAAVGEFFESVDPQVLRDAIAGYKALDTWSTKTVITREAFEAALDMMTHSPDLTGVRTRYTYDSCCNDSFALAVDAT